MTTTTSQTNDLDSTLERIEAIADHGQALALCMVANDQFKDIRPDYLAAMLDDLQSKFRAIKAELENLSSVTK